MPTMREIGKRLYFRNPSSNTVSSASKVGATTSTGSYVRYGTAQADSAEGKVQVKLDNSEDVVTCSCDSPIKQGDRVKVIVTESGALIAMPIGQNIVNYVDQKTEYLADQITIEGNAILSQVNQEMNEFKEDHQLTDTDIQHQISTSVAGATETWEGKLSDVEDGIEQNYALKTEVTTEIGNLSAEISETYATSEGVENEINTAISAASGQIQSTVEQNVMSAVGNTYATKTELTQTSQDLTVKVDGAVNTANTAQETAQEIQSYFTFDTYGLTIGYSGNSIKARISPSGKFQVLSGNNVLCQFGAYTDIGAVNFNSSGSVSLSSIGYGGVATSGWSSRSVPVQELVDMYQNGDYLTGYGTSGSVRYWKWANGRREASGSISVTMSAGGSAGAQRVSLPFSFTDQYSYRVLVSLNTTSTSPPNGYNNVQCMAYGKRSSYFYVTAWNTYSTSVSVTLDWYAIGVGN